MCGILGLYSSESRGPVERTVVERACNTMLHRGPDDWGIEGFRDGRVWLAMRRLAILDLSPAGHQPMVSRDGRYWIVYNGEIYNYREIRARLAGLGHQFVSDCDTEVLLAAYQQWGLQCLDLLNGMWAFVVYDTERDEIICCRDRFGIKPLYYYHGPRGFAAASEIRALLALGWVEPSVHRAALARFLVTGLISGLESTCFDGIYQLRAGHFLRLRRGHINKNRYWWLPPSTARQDTSEEAMIREFRTLFESAVRDHLVSDVPLGTCLSGGLDSSSLTAVAARHTSGRIKTFSSYFEDPDCDERPYAAEVVRACGVEENYIRPTEKDLPEILPKILWHLEEPCKALGVYPQWHVMKLAAEKVTVVLDGQGGDETLAGYDYYFATRAAQLLRQGKLLTWFKEKRSSGKFPSFYQCAQEVFYGWKAGSSNPGKPSPPPWLHSSLAELPLDAGIQPSRRYPEDPVNDQLARDLEVNMLPAFLRYDDKLSMAFSVEARVPYLDRRLVEFLFSRPSEVKCGRGWSKYILRQAMSGIVPEKVLFRRDKKGFPTPFRSWFRKEQLYSWIDTLLDGRLLKEAELLDLKAAKSLLSQHRQGTTDAENRIWRWVVTALWLEEMKRLTNRSRAQPLRKRPAVGIASVYIDARQESPQVGFARASLVVICRNQLDEMQLLVDRLEEQRRDVPDLEVVISDDGSTDGTREFLEPLAAGGQFIYDWHARVGRGLNRNRGASLATGAMLIFIDGDIEPLPGFCQAHIQAHLERPGGLHFSHLHHHSELAQGPVGRYRQGWRARRMRYLEAQSFGRAALGSGAFSIGRREFDTLEGFRQLVQSYGSEDADFFARARKSRLPFYTANAAASHRERPDFITLCRKKFLDGYTTELYGCSQPAPKADNHDGSTDGTLAGLAWSRFRSSPLWRVYPRLVPLFCHLLPDRRSDQWISSVLFQFRQEGERQARERGILPARYLDC